MKVVIETSVHRPAQTVIQRQPALQSPGILTPKPERVPSSGCPAIFLRNARIAYPHGDCLQRKLKNIVQGTKCGWQGNPHALWRSFVVSSDLVRREQVDSRRFVRPGGDTVAMMFPIDAKAHAVRAPLPLDAVGQMEVPRGPVDRRRVSNE